jgi:hypothetical protein
MNEEEIKKLIEVEVSKKVESKLKEEKENLYKIIEHKLLYTGEFAKARRIIDEFFQWTRE